MTIAYWITAGITAAGFLLAGGLKAVRPIPDLKKAGLHWVDDFHPRTVRAIGGAEVVGTVGLILPMLTGIAPILSPVAAVCLTVLMVGAVVVHLRRHESPTPAVVLGVLSLAAAVLGFVVLAG